jgi:uncharacterized protein YaiE (UPF0345 family)
MTLVFSQQWQFCFIYLEKIEAVDGSVRPNQVTMRHTRCNMHAGSRLCVTAESKWTMQVGARRGQINKPGSIPSSPRTSILELVPVSSNLQQNAAYHVIIDSST